LLVLGQAFVEARARGVVFARVVDEVDVELERLLELGLVDLRLVDLPVRRRRPPGAAERVQDGRE
jgi:hypothetical protein